MSHIIALIISFLFYVITPTYLIYVKYGSVEAFCIFSITTGILSVFSKVLNIEDKLNIVESRGKISKQNEGI